MVPILLSLLLAQGQVSPSLTPQQTVQAYVADTMNLSSDALETLLATDYLEISYLGRMLNRSVALDQYRGPLAKDQKPPIYKLADFSVNEIAKGVALAIWVENVSLTEGGIANTHNYRVTSVLRKEGGTWKFVTNQFTEIPYSN